MPIKTTLNPFVTVKELTQVISAAERTVQAWVKEGRIEPEHYKYDNTDVGRPKLLINPIGIPNEYRMEWVEANIENQIHEYSGKLPEWAFEKAVARLDVIRFFKREKARLQENGYTLAEIYEEVAEIYSSGHVLEKAFETLGKVTGYTLKNWEKAYDKARRWDKDVVEAMAPNHGHRKGASVMPKWYSEQVLKGLLSPNRKSVTRVCKEINAELRMQGKEVPCSIKTVQRFVKKWKSNNLDTWVLMREGKKALNDKVSPYIDRDWNVLDVGDVLIADGHVLNFDVKHPVTGKAHRPTMIVFLDGRSRYPVGISMMPTENIDNINEALLDAIQTLGKFPKAVILDNGRAFKAKHFTNSPDFYDVGIAGIYERYGIITHFTLSYHGQSKPIEPWFNHFNESFSKNMATYRGSSIDKKVPRLMRNEKWHQQWYKDVVGDYLPTISETVELIKYWAQHVFGQEAHGGLKKNETPYRLLKDGRGPGVDPALLIDLMFKSRAVTPRRARFTLEGIVYGNDDVLFGVQRRLLVRYTRNIEDRVWVFDPEQNPPELMCVAHAVEAVHPLERLTGEDGEFQGGYRERLNARKRLEKKAHKTAKALAEMNNGRGLEHAGMVIPDDLPDATPFRIDSIETGTPELTDGTEPKIFESSYERFEYLARDKKFENLTNEDIEFIEKFSQSGSYSGLYKEQYDEQVKLILNHQ